VARLPLAVKLVADPPDHRDEHISIAVRKSGWHFEIPIPPSCESASHNTRRADGKAMPRLGKPLIDFRTDLLRRLGRFSTFHIVLSAERRVLVE